MAVFYTVVFTPKEADSWLSFEDRKDLKLEAQKFYKLNIEGEGDQKTYYIYNDKQEKIYNVWEKARGDLIEY